MSRAAVGEAPLPPSKSPPTPLLAPFAVALSWPALVALAGLGCVPAAATRDTLGDAAQARSVAHGCEPRHFAFERVGGGSVTSAELRGRLTVVAFVATYDRASQAEARLVGSALRRHRPRINALGIALEPRESRPMVEAFASALELNYPLAFADADSIAGRGAFDGIQSVPSVVLLDAQGCEVWRHIGLVDAAELEDALTRAGASASN